MLDLFIAINMTVFSILTFSLSYKINGLNRAIVFPQLSLFESSIPLTVQGEEIVLYYDQELVKKTYENYLEKNIKKYVDSYKVEYYFYNTKNGGVCDVNDCQGVEIKFSAELMFGINYERVVFYEIQEGKIHG